MLLIKLDPSLGVRHRHSECAQNLKPVEITGTRHSLVCVNNSNFNTVRSWDPLTVQLQCFRSHLCGSGWRLRGEGPRLVLGEQTFSLSVYFLWLQHLITETHLKVASSAQRFVLWTGKRFLKELPWHLSFFPARLTIAASWHTHLSCLAWCSRLIARPCCPGQDQPLWPEESGWAQSQTWCWIKQPWQATKRWSVFSSCAVFTGGCHITEKHTQARKVTHVNRNRHWTNAREHKRCCFPRHPLSPPCHFLPPPFSLPPRSSFPP